MQVLKSSYRKLLLLAFVYSLNITPAKALVTYQLLDLTQNTVSSIHEHAIDKEFSMVLVFQPDCSWCKKQLSDFELLDKGCQSLSNTVLVGIKGSKVQLKREVNRVKDKYQTLKADTAFIRKLGGVNATPLLLFFDSSGNLLGRKQGYLEFSQLKSAVSRLLNKSC